jgi:hypothetical protein
VTSRKLMFRQPVLVCIESAEETIDGDLKRDRVTPFLRCDARRGIIRHSVLCRESYKG